MNPEQFINGWSCSSNLGAGFSRKRNIAKQTTHRTAYLPHNIKQNMTAKIITKYMILLHFMRKCYNGISRTTKKLVYSTWGANKQKYPSYAKPLKNIAYNFLQAASEQPIVYS